jgi:hypothetical protein
VLSLNTDHLKLKPLTYHQLSKVCRAHITTPGVRTRGALTCVVSVSACCLSDICPPSRIAKSCWIPFCVLLGHRRMYVRCFTSLRRVPHAVRGGVQITFPIGAVVINKDEISKGVYIVRHGLVEMVTPVRAICV